MDKTHEESKTKMICFTFNEDVVKLLCKMSDLPDYLCEKLEQILYSTAENYVRALVDTGLTIRVLEEIKKLKDQKEQ
jgi:hypothetical protein